MYWIRAYIIKLFKKKPLLPSPRCRQIFGIPWQKAQAFANIQLKLPFLCIISS